MFYGHWGAPLEGGADVTKRPFGSLLFSAATALATLACGLPSDERVRAEFLAQHPGYSVLFVGVGEGDGGNAYFHIRYKKPSDRGTFEQAWLYQDVDAKELGVHLPIARSALYRPMIATTVAQRSVALERVP